MGKDGGLEGSAEPPTRDRRDYRYRIESTDTKAAGISIGLDPGIF